MGPTKKEEKPIVAPKPVNPLDDMLDLEGPKPAVKPVEVPKAVPVAEKPAAKPVAVAKVASPLDDILDLDGPKQPQQQPQTQNIQPQAVVAEAKPDQVFQPDYPFATTPACPVKMKNPADTLKV